METTLVPLLGRLFSLVVWILFTMLAILVTAGLVLVFAAYPHRGHDVPKAAWLGDAMRRGADAAPTLDHSADRFGIDDSEIGRREAAHR